MAISVDGPDAETHDRATSSKTRSCACIAIPACFAFCVTRSPGRKVRRLRIRQDLRRLARPRVRTNRELSGRRSALRLSARDGRARLKATQSLGIAHAAPANLCALTYLSTRIKLCS
jgi:hypothetical protein